MKLRASATTVLSVFLWFTAPAFHPSFHRCFISGLCTAATLTNWWHGNSPLSWRSQFKHQSRLGETGVLAHAKPLTPHPSAGAGYPSCDPSSTSVRTELMARSHHSLPVPLALSLLPKVPGRAPSDWEQHWQLWRWREKRLLGAAQLPFCLWTPLPEGDSYKISKTVFPLQTPCLLFFLQTWVHLRLPKLWTCGDICVTLKKAFVCLLLTGSGNCQEIIVKTLCCFSLFVPVISEQPHQCKSDLSPQSYGE